jgi:hypothetical protein
MELGNMFTTEPVCLSWKYFEDNHQTMTTKHSASDKQGRAESGNDLLRTLKCVWVEVRGVRDIILFLNE